MEGEQSLEQIPAEEIVELLLRLQPCIAGNTGHMLHIRRKLRTDLGRQLHHSTGRIEQRNQLQLSDFLPQVLKEWLGLIFLRELQVQESCCSHHNRQIHKSLTDQEHDHHTRAHHHSQCFGLHNHAGEGVGS